MKKEKKIELPTIDLDDAHHRTIEYTTDYLTTDLGFTIDTVDEPVSYTCTEIPIDTVEYRGYSIPIYMDDYGQQYYCTLDGEEIGFGSFNTNYEEDLHYLIDKKLDTICDFIKYPGAFLYWFENGYSNKDIKLVYRSRILKVFLISNAEKVIKNKYETIKKESLEILEKYINLLK